jgi:hypothetical protein
MAAGLVVTATLALALWMLDGADGPATLPLGIEDVPGGGTPPRVTKLERLVGEPTEGARRPLDPSGSASAPDPAVAGRWFPVDDTPAPSPEALAALIDALRDDGIPDNAGDAMRQLIWLMDRNAAREPVTQALTGALDSLDSQQRYFAALALIKSWVDEPPERLLDVAVDMMCSGRREGPARGLRDVQRSGWAPRDDSIRYLMREVDRAEGRLLDLLGLYRDDEARFLAAFVLARTDHPEHTDRLAPALIHHMASNRIGGDAVMAMNALMDLDRQRVIWWLQSGTQPDEQFQRSKRLLLVALRNGGHVPADVLAEDNVVTSRVHNPVIGWRFRSYD